MFAYRRKKHSKIFNVSVKSYRQSAMTWKTWVWGAAIILALAGLLYLAIYSPFLKIKNWNLEAKNFSSVESAQNLVERFFEEKVWEIIPRNNWLVFLNNTLSNRILAAYPEAAAVDINRDILRGVKITVVGRQPAAFWCQTFAIATSTIMAGEATTTESDLILPQSGTCYFTDNNGLIFREAPQLSGTALPTFFSRPGQEFNIGDVVIGFSTVQLAAQLKKELRNLGIEPIVFTLAVNNSQELTVFTSEGWQIYFDLSRSAQSQVKILGALLDSEIKDKRAGLKYIDLRLANKVYYK